MQAVLPNYIQVIDISDNNSSVNISQITSNSIKAIIAKATEGATGKDPTFPKYYQQAKQYGFIHGSYNFARPATSSAVDEANAYVAYVTANGGFDMLPPILDIEDNGGLNKTQLTQWVHDWCNTIIKLTGRQPILYTYPGFAESYFDTTLNVYDWWIADYGVSTAPDVNGKSNWLMWQFTETGKVAGVIGDVDMSWFAGTLDDLKAYCNIEGGVTLQTGDSGTQVKQLQEDLKLVLGLPSTFTIDGDYGSQTSAAVRSFQTMYNVKPVDGIAGSITMAALQKAVSAKNATVTTPKPVASTPIASTTTDNNNSTPTSNGSTLNTALSSAQQQLQDIETEVQKVQAELASTQAQLTSVQNDLASKQQEASALQTKITNAQNMMKNALDALNA